jgi:hypothetical protein
MNDRSHSVVGLIDLPVHASWSPDALVRTWMTTQPVVGHYDTMAEARSDYSPGEPRQHIRADLVQLCRELDELLDAFLEARSTQVS